MLKKHLRICSVWLLIGLPVVALAAHAQDGQAQEPESEIRYSLDLASIPISNWLQDAETSEIPLNFRVSDPTLRMDQRLEVAYLMRVSAKNLNRTGHMHELFMISQITDADDEWFSNLNVLPYKVNRDLPSGLEVRFGMRFIVKPGTYMLSVVLYDRVTGKHSALKRRIEVRSLRNDPLPDAFSAFPPAEFPVISDEEDNPTALFRTSSDLFLPVGNKRPIELELISTLSPPEQWARRARMVRIHNDNIQGALAALSQMDLRRGSISVTGLDLVRREVSLEQKDLEVLDWTALSEAFEKAGSSLISTTALEGRKDNGTFFREFLNHKLSLETPEDQPQPLRVLIVITGSLLFERGSDLSAIQLEGDCQCRVYHLRFRLALDDVFDELQKVMKPLRPRTFNLMTPQDLRKAIGAIIDDLQEL